MMLVGRALCPISNVFKPFQIENQLLISIQTRQYRKHPDNNPKYSLLKSKEFVHGSSSEENSKFIGVSDKNYPLPVKWIRPRHVYRMQVQPDGSGDCSTMPTDMDMTQPRPHFLNLSLSRKDKDLANTQDDAALADVPPNVRRILSLEYGRGKDKYIAYRRELVSRVQLHPYDFSSLDANIASLTARIRHYGSELGWTKRSEGSKSGSLRHRVKIWVDHRRVLLRYLRDRDYKRFEFVLEQLDLVYKPRPFAYELVMRRKSIKMLTQLWCEELRAARLNSLKAELKSQQPAFLRAKAEKLRWIMDEESALKVKSKSVGQSEIDDCLAMANKIEAEMEAAKPVDGTDAETDRNLIYKKDEFEEVYKFITG